MSLPVAIHDRLLDSWITLRNLLFEVSRHYVRAVTHYDHVIAPSGIFPVVRLCRMRFEEVFHRPFSPVREVPEQRLASSHGGIEMPHNDGLKQVGVGVIRWMPTDGEVTLFRTEVAVLPIFLVGGVN